jgi:hypothetical protein
MTSKDLNNHVFLTYAHLRSGMGIIALVLPFILWGGGLAAGIHLQSSLSDYYYSSMRNYFVGILFALGSFMFLYKGFSWQENYALHLAGVLAILIAVVPTDDPGNPQAELTPTALLHKLFAVFFFLTIAYVCLFRSADTLPLLGSGLRAKVYYWTYKVIGIYMAIVPLVLYYFEFHRYQRVFFAEATSIWTFGAYWLLKTKEISDSQADRVVAVLQDPRVGGLPPETTAEG